MSDLQVINERHATAVAAQNPAALLQIAVSNGASLEQLERLMALQERWESNEAKRAFNQAFAAFKADGVRIVKNIDVKDGPLRGKKYADLFAVVDALTPALSRHGLSASWRVTQDQKDWIEVTCVLSHVGGHSESVAMGGPPDVGGAKNPIQARASVHTYLRRYTFLAITGMAASDDDDDGGGGQNGRAQSADTQAWINKANAAKTEEELNSLYGEAMGDFERAKDGAGARQFKEAALARREEIRKEAKNGSAQ